MKRINRRDLIASIAAYATLTANRASAACDVSRSRGQGFSTKSYRCDVAGQPLTTTFLRVSDVLFESAGRTPLPGDFGNYQALVEGHDLIDTPALRAFTHLLENHSFSFEPNNLRLQFDGRAAGAQANLDNLEFERSGPIGRWRTMGVWDEPNPEDWPLFPLPHALRNAMRGEIGAEQLRYATPADFVGLDAKMQDYLALWRTYEPLGGLSPWRQESGGPTMEEMGNLSLLQHIRAGSVDGFLPLLVRPFTGYGECTGMPHGGAHYVPPALYLDIAVCRNDGSAPVGIEDFFGVTDSQEQLRSYATRTPDGAERFRWDGVRLDPGRSVLIVQRLLFGALPFHAAGQDKKIVPQRAVFGQTHLPKGVVVAGTPVAFDGRSHNALIVGSYYDKGSCPYLFSWCDQTREWVHLGKVLADCIGPARRGEEVRQFTGLRHRFKLVEREHECSTLTSCALTLGLTDGSTITLPHDMPETVLEIGERLEVDFALPETIPPETVAWSRFAVRGYYEKYTADTFAERTSALEGAG